MYRLIFFPYEELDPIDGQHPIMTLPEVLRGLMRFIYRRYGLENDPDIFRILGLLFKYNEDDEVQLFALHFILRWEHRTHHVITDAYTGKGIFGAADVSHFNMYMRRIWQFVEQTIVFPINPQNAPEVVHNFVQACRTEYLMGPFLDNGKK